MVSMAAAGDRAPDEGAGRGPTSSGAERDERDRELASTLSAIATLAVFAQDDLASAPNAARETLARIRELAQRGEALLRSPAGSPQAAREADATSLGTILLAEDDRTIRFSLTRILEHEGYRVVVACDGVDAVEQFAAHPEIELAVLDMTMPRLSGVDAYLQMTATRPALPVIFASGHGLGELDESFFVPPQRVLQPKPFDVDELLGHVRRLLAAHV